MGNISIDCSLGGIPYNGWLYHSLFSVCYHLVAKWQITCFWTNWFFCTTTLVGPVIKYIMSNWYRRKDRAVFSFECRQVIDFTSTTLNDWLKNLAPLCHSIRSKSKTNHDSLTRVFPRFASATCNYFQLWLVHCIVCLLWLAGVITLPLVYDSYLKIALLTWHWIWAMIYACFRDKTSSLVELMERHRYNRGIVLNRKHPGFPCRRDRAFVRSQVNCSIEIWEIEQTTETKALVLKQ